jgi:hypothetical protein
MNLTDNEHLNRSHAGGQDGDHARIVDCFTDNNQDIFPAGERTFHCLYYGTITLVQSIVPETSFVICAESSWLQKKKKTIRYRVLVNTK